MVTLQDEQENYRVLSIQSHTVSGYCGNKAAVFPLQTLGFDVDILNTVQFSNHTGYPSFTGNRMTAENVQDLFEGLESNGLIDDYSHVLTGYIGNYAILEKIEAMVEKLKAKNPKLIYVCDTVMGDGGALYVAPEIIPLYRNIMRLADVVTPNQFEAEILTETKINSLTDAGLVAKKLHALGSAHVVITTLSIPFEHVPLEIHLDSSCEKSLYCFTSQVLADGTIDQHIISFPTFEGYFTGTGDLFSSLVVARLQESIDKSVDRVPCLIDAAYRVICTVNAITKKTFVYQQRLLASNPDPAKIARIRELHLIQGKKEIEEPERIGLGVVKKIRVESQINK